MTIRDYIASVLGEYTPVCNAEGVPLVGINSVDWEYIVCAVILVVSIYCTWKLLGAIIAKIG